MDKLNNYFKEYQAGSNAGNFVEVQETGDPKCSISGYGPDSGFFGYTCSVCYKWVNPGEYHYCNPFVYPYVSYSQQRNRTEEAFKILKVLVKEDVIKEPSSFKKFCEIIEKIAKVI